MASNVAQKILAMLTEGELEFVDANSVPLSRWPDIYRNIPDGKALVLPIEQMNPRNVWAALHRYHKKGEFLGIEFRRVADEDGDKVYLINGGKSEA